jgi:hypothetical protein
VSNYNKVFLIPINRFITKVRSANPKKRLEKKADVYTKLPHFMHIPFQVVLPAYFIIVFLIKRKRFTVNGCVPIIQSVPNMVIIVKSNKIIGG